MPFNVEDFHDLVRLLDAYPEWQRELRRVILTEELLTLPEVFRTFLVEEQPRTEARLDALTEAQARTEEKLSHALQRVGRAETRLGRIEGQLLEKRFCRRAPTYLGSAGFRRIRVPSLEDLALRWDDLEDAGTLTPADKQELLEADAILIARDSLGELWAAVEVSTTVDPTDVDRARRRALILERLFGRGLGLVAGYTLTEDAGRALTEAPVVLWLRVPER